LEAAHACVVSDDPEEEVVPVHRPIDDRVHREVIKAISNASPLVRSGADFGHGRIAGAADFAVGTGEAGLALARVAATRGIAGASVLARSAGTRIHLLGLVAVRPRPAGIALARVAVDLIGALAIAAGIR
jgi:hypothetical protein